MDFSSPGQVLDDAAFAPATLVSVHPCPARSDYLELRFDTADGLWDWCFAEPAASVEPEVDAGAVRLAVVLGRYGAVAHTVADGALGPALPSTAALPLIRAGAEVRIARQLVFAGR
jgi:hypothetical protein